MQKIMFDDRYDLTNLVLSGRKTQTRRLEKTLQSVPQDRQIFRLDQYGYDTEDERKYCEIKMGAPIVGETWYEIKPYIHMWEEVAIAMRYHDVMENRFMNLPKDEINTWYKKLSDVLGIKPEAHMGWGNKQSVRPDFMPGRIYIDNIRVQHIQDISEEDCLAEGIQVDLNIGKGLPTYFFKDVVKNKEYHYNTPKEAFKALIEREGCSKAWENNGLVIVYDFHLVPRKKF